MQDNSKNFMEVDFDLISKLMAEGNFNEAEDICINILDNDEKNADAYCKLGEIYLLREKDVEAQVFFEKAIKINPHLLNIKERIDCNNVKKLKIQVKLSGEPVSYTDIEIWKNTIDVLYSNKTKTNLEQVTAIAKLGEKIGIRENPLCFESEKIALNKKLTSSFVIDFLADRELSPWALAPAVFEYLNGKNINEHRILEFGAGVSTEFLALKLSKIYQDYNEGHLILSIEQNEEFVEETNILLKRRNLDRYAKVLYAPLADINFRGLKFKTYDITKHIDLIAGFKPTYFLIDGPSGGGLNRLGSFIIASKFASKNSKWFLDDSLRDAELKVLKICAQLGIQTSAVIFQGRGISEGVLNGNEHIINDLAELYINELSNIENQKARVN